MKGCAALVSTAALAPIAPAAWCHRAQASCHSRLLRYPNIPRTILGHGPAAPWERDAMRRVSDREVEQSSMLSAS